MPNELLSRLVTQSNPNRIHPHLRRRDEDGPADDFVKEEPAVLGLPLIATPARAEQLAVVALLAAFALGVAAVVGVPF